MQKPWIQDTLTSVLEYGTNDAALPAAALASAGKLSNQQARRARCYKVDHALRLIWLSDGKNCVAAVLTPAALQQVRQKSSIFGITRLALHMFNELIADEYATVFAEENANTPLDNTHVILRDWHWSTVSVCNKGPRQWPATQPFCVHISELRHWGARNTTATSAVTDINLERQVCGSLCVQLNNSGSCSTTFCKCRQQHLLATEHTCTSICGPVVDSVAPRTSVRDKLRRFESNRAELLNCIMSAQGIQTLLDGQGEPYCSMLHTANTRSVTWSDLPPWLHTLTGSTSTSSNAAAAAQSPARPAKAAQQQSDAPVPVHLLQQQQDVETQEGLFDEDPDVCTQQHFQYSNTYSGEQQHNGSSSGSGNSSYEQQQQHSQEQFQEQSQEQSQEQDGPFLAGGNVLSAGQDPNFQPLSSLSENGDE
eukprot:7485-Heterococcus_DN1.PRE.1